MAKFIQDDINWSLYEQQTECKAKVRRAAEFSDALVDAFRPRDGGVRDPEMFTTKLRGLMRFRPGEVTAWAGYNGAKKSMFLGQLAIDFCVQRQRTLVMSLEMRPEKTLQRMARQAAAVEHPSEPWLTAFSSWTDGRLWLFDHLGRITPSLCVAVLRYFADEMQGTQVVIDSMMMVCKSEEHLDEQKQFTTDLVRIAQETGLHVHLVTHCRKPQSGDDKPPSKYDLRGSAAISDQCANVITLWWNTPKHAKLAKDPSDIQEQIQPDYAVTVTKQRDGEFEGRLQMWFNKECLRFCDDRNVMAVPYELSPL